MNGDAMLKIDAVLEEIENYVAGASRMPLVDRVMIKDDELFHLMDKLRQELPREVSDAMEVCRRRDEIIGAARTESEQIIAKANTEAEDIIEKTKRFAQKTVDEHALVAQANEQARNIVEEANAKAKEMTQEAEAQAKQLKEAAESETAQMKADVERYANQLFDHVLANMNTAMAATQNHAGGIINAMENIHNDVGSAMQAMQQAKEQIHAANSRS